METVESSFYKQSTGVIAFLRRINPDYPPAALCSFELMCYYACLKEGIQIDPAPPPRGKDSTRRKRRNRVTVRFSVLRKLFKTIVYKNFVYLLCVF